MTVHSNSCRLLAVPLTVLSLLAIGTVAHAGSAVVVDFSDSASDEAWGGNLATLAGGVGMAAFSDMEVAALESTIISELERIYTDFDVTFSTGAPTAGDTNVIDFTKDIMSSAFTHMSLPKGIADSDWLNVQAIPPSRTFQLAEVFPQSFDDIVDEFAGSTADMRPGMLTELGIALGGTAAHELGHSFALSHYDAYGDPAVGFASPGPGMGEYIISGIDPTITNSHLMATGVTGITESDRESMRTLSRYSEAKLEIASDPSVTTETLTSTPFDHTEEVPGPKTDFETAQPISSTPLPISGLEVANVHAASLGDLGAGGTDIDFYGFELLGPGLVTMEVLSKEIYASGVETVVALFDETGMLKFLGDDLDYAASMMFFSSGAFDVFTDGIQDDPLVLHMDLMPGTYFVGVGIDPDGEHFDDPTMAPLFYDLFITAESPFAAIPEPTTTGWFLLLIGFFFGRRLV